MAALFGGVMQRVISAGSERLLSGRKDNSEQREGGKQPQKHLFRQLGMLDPEGGACLSKLNNAYL